MPVRESFDCLWCGQHWTVRDRRDLEAWAHLCPECLGRAGDNPFLRARLRTALAERAGAAPEPAATSLAGAAQGRVAAPAAGPGDADLVAYYDARAAEYDDFYLRRGRYGRGVIETLAWQMELDQATAWLDDLPLGGRIVELAAGTGWWSPLLAARGELWCYDAAAAPLELARQRLVAHHLLAHIHQRDAWASPEPPPAGALFTGFWLGHVPRERLAGFLRLAHAWLAPGGTYGFIDARPDAGSGADGDAWEAATEFATHRLGDGRVFRVPTVYYEPAELERALRAAGFTAPSVTTSGRFFLLGRATA
ncbi:MAG: class I SAM-dependent methyltransferase [Candidatus Limnocylindrales bacterium]